MHSSSGIKYSKTIHKCIWPEGGGIDTNGARNKMCILHSLIMNDSIRNQSAMNLSNLTVTKVTIKNHSMTLTILLVIFILEWIDKSERFDPSGTNIT